MAEAAVHWLLGVLALPKIGLSSVFVVAFVSATLVPMGSEPTVFAVIKANPGLFWPAILVAALGNTLGGAVDYWLGYGAKRTLNHRPDGRLYLWLRHFGPKTMLLAWLPVVGDPICTLAGWLKLPFWPSLAYMALGKTARYLLITSLLLAVPDGFWHRVAQLLG